MRGKREEGRDGLVRRQTTNVYQASRCCWLGSGRSDGRSNQVVQSFSEEIKPSVDCGLIDGFCCVVSNGENGSWKVAKE